MTGSAAAQDEIRVSRPATRTSSTSCVSTATSRSPAAAFTDPDVQRKINEMSVRATARLAMAGATPKVASDFSGDSRSATASSRAAAAGIQHSWCGRGAEGQHVLQRETLAFLGNLFMDAKVSEATTGWKSVLLKMVDPLFRKNGQTVIPLKIGGTRSAPSFGMDVGRLFKQQGQLTRVPAVRHDSHASAPFHGWLPRPVRPCAAL